MQLNGSKDRLRELFVILLDNAIKYSPNNSVVTISAKSDRKFHTISVTDTGIEIEEKDISHVFDRFFRADTSRSKANVAGYGLGLSIAKKIVKIHNGAIDVKSTINKGATFSVLLPR